MKKVFGLMLLLVFGFCSYLWAVPDYSDLITYGSTSSYVVYEQHKNYPDGYQGLDYVLKNEGNDYIWAFLVGLHDSYKYTYPVFSGEGKDIGWVGRKYWKSDVLWTKNLPVYMTNELISLIAYNYNDEYLENLEEQLSDFISNKILPLLDGYDYVYFTRQLASWEGDGFTPEMNPIEPGEKASGFGVIDRIAMLASPVVYVGSSSKDVYSQNNTWSVMYNNAKHISNNSVVPEPANIWLILVGLFFVVFMVKRSKLEF